MFDLNLKYKSISKEKHILFLKHIYSLGFNTIAWNTSVVGKVNKNSSSHLKPTPIVELQYNIPQLKNDIEFLKSCSLHRNTNTLKHLFSSSPSSNIATNETSILKQLSRITLTIDDIQDAHCLNATNEILTKFDIVAVCPGNDAIFSYLCKTAEIDIICLDFTHKLSYPFQKKLIDEAVSRGIFFEILYSTLTSSSQHIRREVLSGTKILLHYLQYKHVIFSSGSDNDTIQLLRSPLDICSIGHLLDVDTINTKKAINENCRSIIQHGILRKNKINLSNTSTSSNKDFNSIYSIPTIQYLHTDEFKQMYPNTYNKFMVPPTDNTNELSMIEQYRESAKKVKIQFEISEEILLQDYYEKSLTSNINCNKKYGINKFAGTNAINYEGFDQKEIPNNNTIASSAKALMNSNKTQLHISSSSALSSSSFSSSSTSTHSNTSQQQIFSENISYDHCTIDNNFRNTTIDTDIVSNNNNINHTATFEVKTNNTKEIEISEVSAENIPQKHSVSLDSNKHIFKKINEPPSKKIKTATIIQTNPTHDHDLLFETAMDNNLITSKFKDNNNRISMNANRLKKVKPLIKKKFNSNNSLYKSRSSI